MSNILVICPTINNPELMCKISDSFLKTSTGVSDLFFVLEDNDPWLQDYLWQGVKYSNTRHIFLQVLEHDVNPIPIDIKVSAVLSKIKLLNIEILAYGVISDTMMFTEENWDKTIAEKFLSQESLKSFQYITENIQIDFRRF